MLFLHLGMKDSHAQCGPNTLAFNGSQPIYNTACGNNSYQVISGSTPSGTGNSFRWEVSFSGASYSTIVNNSGIPVNSMDLSKNDITNFVLTPAGNGSGDYRIRRIVTNAGAGCSNTSQPVFLYYSQSSATTSGGTITGNDVSCSPASGSLTVSGNTGPVLRWESAPGSGGPWTTISNNTNTLAYSGLTAGTCYRALIDNICDGTAGSVDAFDKYSTTFCITVNSIPAITVQPLSQDVCIGSGLSLSVTATSATPMTYQWRKNGFDINGAVSATYNVGVVSNSDAGNYDVVITNDCGQVTSTVAVVTVKPIPIASVPSNSVVCPGASVPGTAFASSPAGATFTWTNSNPAIGLGLSGSGNISSFIAANTSTTAITATITVIPTLNGCAGPASSYTITVNPTAVVAVPGDFDVCAGATVSATNFLGTPSGTTFTWSSSGDAIGLPATSGPGNVPSFTAVNAGTTTLSTTITVTPSVNGCVGTPSSYTITVNPLPVIVSATATNELTCGGNNGTITVDATGTGPLTYTIVRGAFTQNNSTGFFGPLAPGSYSVVVSNASGCIATDIVTISSPGAPDAPLLDVAPSEVCESGNIFISIKNPINNATYTWTTPGGITFSGVNLNSLTRANADLSMSGEYAVTVSVSGCVSEAKVFSILVKRRPVINAPPNLVFCPGTSVPAADFISTPAGASYSWINSNTAIGLAGSGDGAIPDFTTSNTTNSPITATITVIPTLDGCTGDAVSYTITVNPSPVVVTNAPVVVCHGSTIPEQTFTSNVADATFSWTVTALGATFSGTGPIPSFPAVNNGVTPIVGTVTVTASSAGCSSSVMTYNITVNPLPRVTNAPLNQVTCAGTATSVVELTSDVADATFSWTAVASPGITGFTSGGNGNIPAEMLTNTGTVQGTVTYTIIATANGCSGPATTYVVRVDPLPKLLSSINLSQTICSGSATTAINLSSEVTGTLFNWTASASGSITGFQASGTNQTQLPSQTLFNSGSSPQTVTYTIVPISDGCSGPVSIYTITVNPLPTATLSGTATVCYGADATLNVALTGTAPWAITYSDGISFFTISGINSNSYNFQVSATSTKTYTIASVTDAICTNVGLGTATITQPSAPLAATSSATNVSCFAGTDGTISFTGVSGGSGSYQYSIDGGSTWQTSASFTGLAPGTYSLQLRDAGNLSCTFVVNTALVITQPSAALSAAIGSSTNVLCFGTSTGSASVNVSGGTAPYSFLWSNGATTANLQNVPAGSYTVNISDANGCSLGSVLSVTITQPASALSASVNSTNVNCFGGNNGSITLVNTTGGSGNYEYSINGGTSWQAAAVFNSLVAGTYHVLIRDGAAASCVYTVNATLAITQPSAPLDATASATNVTCFGNNNGSISFTGVSGGSGSYQYSIDGGVNWQAGASFTGLAPGTYSLQLRDAGNLMCTLSVNNSLVITQPLAALSAAIGSSTNVLCYGASTGTASINVSGGTAPYSYLWSNGATTANLQNVPAGTYTVNVSDANGCSLGSALTVTITQPAFALNASANSKNVSCFGGNDGSVTLVDIVGGSGNYEYSINGGTNWQGSPVFNNLTAGTYHVLIRDSQALACVFSVNTSLIITQPPALTATAVTSDISCFGASDGTITVSNMSGGSGSYQYSIDGGVNWQNGSSFAGLKSGVYAVQMRDAVNTACVFAVNTSLTLNQPAILSAAVEFKHVTCRGSADGVISVINASGGYGNYEFSKDGGLTWQSSSTFTNVAPGSYNVKVRDLVNPACVQTLNASVVIRQADEPLVSGITSQVNVNCFGSATGSVTLFVRGGIAPYTFLWSNGASSKDLVNVAAGSYTVIIKDSFNCVSTQTITISQPSEPLTINFAKNDVTCFGASNGLISLTVSGGKAPYTYKWDNGRITKDITNLPAGSYTIFVSDANGCSQSQQIIVDQPAQSLFVNVVKTNVTCFGASDGSITLNVTGGALPYSYNWSSGQRTSSLTGVGPGVYSVTIVDANGCSLRETVSIIQPSAPLRMSLAIKNTVCRTSRDGSITATITGGTSPYTVLWNGRSQSSNIISALPAGSYEITVMDANGCKFIANAQVVAGICPPVAIDDSFKIYEGSSATGTTALNDFDRENEKLSFSNSAQAKNGILVFHNDGSFIYTPNPGFLGTETVPYKICNTSGVCSSANLIIRVVPFSTVNLTPEISNVREGKKVSVTARLERVFPDDVIIKIGYSGSAVKDRDYVLLDQFIQIMIPKGQLTTTQKITIAALTDDQNEGDESIIIQILSTSDPEVKIGTGSVVTIGDVYPPEPVEIEKKDAPINRDITIDPLFSPNNDGSGNDVFNIVNIVSFPDNEVIIFNRWGNEVFRIKGYNESDRVFKGYANTGLLANSNTPLVDGVYYYLVTTRRTINGTPVTALNKGYLILRR